MSKSANTPSADGACVPHLSARMQKTRLSITRTARVLTAEHGFNRFTIEQLCAQVGISRRTFFNYFPSKIDAVFGHGIDEVPEGAIERFMAARPATAQGLSPTLLADLVALIIEQLTFDEQAILSTHGFFQVAHREPELLQRMMQLGPKKDTEFVSLICAREEIDASDPMLFILLHTLRMAVIKAIETYVDGTGERSLSEEFLKILEASQRLFSQPVTRS